MKLSDKVFIIATLAVFSIIFIGYLYQWGMISDPIFSLLLYTGPVLLLFSMKILKISKNMKIVYIAVYFHIFSYFVSMVFVGSISENFREIYPNLQIIVLIFLLSTLLYPVLDVLNNRVYLMFNKKENIVKNPHSIYNKLINLLKILSLSSFFIIVFLVNVRI